MIHFMPIVQKSLCILDSSILLYLPALCHKQDRREADEGIPPAPALQSPSREILCGSAEVVSFYFQGLF